ncbi:nicotinate-nucleotide adenylyltransferase [Paracoccus halophilus]|uniref:Probable nicotinate-nucleotide adenylyltransferase n=2 Tax=Paracoccus halophilus TaxID=376733 RepID=A0A099F6P3_9RHOB|nr:nicotinate-nucleotide adenylyltransferase [Paracoccus halophilus]SFA46169.1 nicotinate-nucleotide adenylyltransferase [Paracoccus halophilus]
MKVGLLGGSFDPAHEGHVHITKMAMRRFGLDRIWWLVTPGNPLKAHGPAPLEDRIARARAMIHDPRVEITGLEARLGTRLTSDTIAALQQLYPHVRFVWLMGADNLVQFDRWENWREIAARVPIGVIARPGWRMRARNSRAAHIMWRARMPEADARQLADARTPAWVMINVKLSKQSSSEIRANARGSSR